MSLEQALAANTAALQALTAALLAHPVLAPSIQPAPAPFTAAAVPQPTAPGESTAGVPAPTSAFAQPAPTAPLPAAPAAPPTASPAAVADLDSKGMPWDGRIHASTKNKIADGTWRYKRGVTAEQAAVIEAEMRTAMAAPPAPVAASVAGVPVGGVGTPWPFPDPAAPAAAPVAAAPVGAPVIAAPVAAPVVPAPAAAVPPPPVAAPVAAPAVPPANAPAPVAMSYEQFVAKMPELMMAGKIDAAGLQVACEKAGIPSIAALQARPDLVGVVVYHLGVPL